MESEFSLLVFSFRILVRLHLCVEMVLRIRGSNRD
jgi:hypothetical protein